MTGTTRCPKVRPVAFFVIFHSICLYCIAAKNSRAACLACGLNQFDESDTDKFISLVSNGTKYTSSYFGSSGIPCAVISFRCIAPEVIVSFCTVLYTLRNRLSLFALALSVEI